MFFPLYVGWTRDSCFYPLYGLGPSVPCLKAFIYTKWANIKAKLKHMVFYTEQSMS